MPAMLLFTDYGRAEGPYDAGGVIAYSSRVFRLGYLRCHDCGSGGDAHYILSHFSKIASGGSSFSYSHTAASLPDKYKCVLERTDTRPRLFYPKSLWFPQSSEGVAKKCPRRKN